MKRNKLIEMDLLGHAEFLALDDTSQLIFAADHDRINLKSYTSWADGRGAPVHTMGARLYPGPLAVLPNGRLVRGGRGSALSWVLDELETHVETMELIGEDRYIYDGGYTELDEDVGIGWSTGSDPHFTVPFSQEDFEPYRWHLHRPTRHMLCAEDGQYGLRVASLDLEHGGAVVARYLGHGGAVRKFSTSPGDAHLFAAACRSDGFARLYDIRTPLPIITICAEGNDSLTGDVFTHIDGLPSKLSMYMDNEDASNPLCSHILRRNN